MGHPIVFEFANRLVDIAPDGLNHVFFTNSGSESVDTALKIALAYHRVKGDGSRFRLIGRERGYHGVNFGGISVGGIVTNRKMFGTLLTGVDHMPHTHLPAKNAFTRGEPEHGAELADELERIVTLHDASTIAAVIVEPVAGSTGVLIPPKGYLQKLRAICDKHGILLIFDEVITGFGRLGTPFAADYFGVMPDIMITAKGVTNGVIPMGAVFVKSEIHDAFMNGPEHLIEFFHGYTYSGNPIACAAGLGTLDTYKEEGLLTRGAELAAHWEDALHSLKGEPHVIDIRNIGLVGAIELRADRRQPDQAGLLGLRQGVRARRADPHHRRHHRAVAAADHHQGPDQRADRPCARSAEDDRLDRPIRLRSTPKHGRTRRESANQSRPFVGFADGDGEDRPGCRRRQQPPDADRRGRRGPPSLQALVRGGRARGRRRPDGHDVRAPRGHRSRMRCRSMSAAISTPSRPAASSTACSACSAGWK